jgi:phosphate starvation-inducible protein PhoH
MKQNIKSPMVDDEESDLDNLKKKRQKKLLNRLYDVTTIEPMTNNQAKCFDFWRNGKNLMMYGSAGSGKTFLAIYFALQELKLGKTESIYIVRSAVPTREQGFLPGSLAEKMAMYEVPYRDIFKTLTNRGDVYDILKEKGLYEFMSTSYIRGMTIDNAVIIVDEFSNLTLHELDSIITRVGLNSRIIFCGDTKQSDLSKKNERDGVETFMNIINMMPSFRSVQFSIDDIVRSGLVREYLLARHKYENS